MPTFQSTPAYEHGSPESLGVLVVNLGTPDDPSPGAVRRYLRQFLSDPRVVEIPRPIWLMILYGFILPFRPKRSAEAYAKIWTEDGSPLLRISEDITRSLQDKLKQRFSGPVHAELGMSYGSPSIPAALDKLYAQGARRIVVLPLYPQYSGTTTASVFEAVTAALSTRRWVPELRFINHYHDAPVILRHSRPASGITGSNTGAATGCCCRFTVSRNRLFSRVTRITASARRRPGCSLTPSSFRPTNARSLSSHASAKRNG